MENQKSDSGKKGSFLHKVIGGAIIVIAILLIIFIGPKQKSEVASVSTDAGTTAETDGGALKVIQPVIVGDYKYEWKGIQWIFDTKSPEVAGSGQTWVKMEFADFTRNGNAIAFGTPYKLGVHPGTCKQVDFIDTSSESGIPFSYAECSDGATVHEFVVLQDKEQIMVKMNEKKSGKETGWKDWYKIDVASVVE
jgi:hypothetical protein